MDTLQRIALTPVLIGIHSLCIISELLSSSSPSLRTGNSTKVPKHVGFSLITSRSSGRDSGSSSTRAVHGGAAGRLDGVGSLKGKEKARVEWDGIEREMIRCVEEVVEWAKGSGVEEISLWNEDGLLQSVLPALIPLLVSSPPSPPSSGTSSPPPYTRNPLPTEISRSSDSRRDQRHGDDERSRRELGGADVRQGQREEVRTFTVWPELEDVLARGGEKDTSPSKPLMVHILPSIPFEETIADITRRLAANEGVKMEDIVPEMIDELVLEALHFKQNPELLIIHHLPSWDDWDPSTPPCTTSRLELSSREKQGQSWRYRALRSVLPEEAAEIRGYPFWALRLSEIYHSVSRRGAAGCRSRRSTSTRRRRRRGETDDPSQPVEKDGIDTTVEGHADADNWDDALWRWRGVEQRLGR